MRLWILRFRYLEEQVSKWVLKVNPPNQRAAETKTLQLTKSFFDSLKETFQGA